jgi:hypothetical protein
MKQRGAKAEFKRQLVLGSIWTTFDHRSDKLLGVRSVSIVQTNAVAFKTDRGDSWLSLNDKTADYTNPAPGTFQLYSGDNLILTYQLQLTPKE